MGRHRHTRERERENQCRIAARRLRPSVSLKHFVSQTIARNQERAAWREEELRKEILDLQQRLQEAHAHAQVRPPLSFLRFRSVQAD